jgi:hypothetical protein
VIRWTTTEDGVNPDAKALHEGPSEDCSGAKSTVGEGQEVEGLADSPHPPVSAISFLISLTHRALPDVLLQESAGIGCVHFEPFIISGYTPSSLRVVGIFLIFASIGAGHISLHRGLYSN